MPMYRPPVLGGDNSDSRGNSRDYGGTPRRVLSNVQMHDAPVVNPLSSQTLGRAKTMWAFRNPVAGQGTFINQDEGNHVELPKSDPGSSFALNKEY